MEAAIQDYFNGLCCVLPVVNYNFDVESSNWAGAGITNKATFESSLNVTCGAFAITGNKIEAEILTISGNTLGMGSGDYYLTKINYITVLGIITLNLSNNLLTEFNPSKPLPNTLQELFLIGNQIVTFNPTLTLPSSLTLLNLNSNLMTTAGYTSSETWANGMHTAPSGGTIELVANTDSASGTNFETILTSKGWTVNT